MNITDVKTEASALLVPALLFLFLFLFLFLLLMSFCYAMLRYAMLLVLGAQSSTPIHPFL